MCLQYIFELYFTWRNACLVIYAMGVIHGDQIWNLSVGVVELLILVAVLHDIGMVYDETDRENTLINEETVIPTVARSP